MTLSLIALDEPSSDFAAVFTRNAFPGAPVKIGRQRLQEPLLAAVLVNNKVSNVCAPEGEEAVEILCRATEGLLELPPKSVFPGSTGVIGWRLPTDEMVRALPDAVKNLQSETILPTADGIMTTDLYAKIRSESVCGGRIVGIAKGAGMIEPNLATMLVYILTDVKIERLELRSMLARAVSTSFNRMSIDGDTSTSDTVLAVSSGLVPCQDLVAFEAALTTVCSDLAEDVVRNGEGVRHVIRVAVRGAPDEDLAAAIGKSVVNAPLFKCAIAGNDPNVGRLVQAVGKYVGIHRPGLDLNRTSMRLGGTTIVQNGQFCLEPTKETALVQHLVEAELYKSAPDASGEYCPPISYPRHEKFVEVEIDLGLGAAAATVLGADLTHEYVTENADYRS